MESDINTMHPANNKTLFIVVGALALLALGYYLFSNSDSVSGPNQYGGTSESSVVKNAPQVSNDQLLGKQELTVNQSADIAAHKAEILARVSSGKPLTSEEKATIGRIMLTEAHLYHFNETERQEIFAALKR